MENKQLLKRSLDMKYYRTQLIGCSVIVVLFDLLLAVLMFLSDTPGELMVGVVVYHVFWIGAIGYLIFKVTGIMRHPDRYRLYEAVAVEAHRVMRGRMSFTLSVTHADGSTFEAETNGIFGTGILTDRYWGDSMGQKLQILYDESTERVVVVKRLGN